MLRRIIDLGPEYENKEDIILRDFLAIERTKLANERTLLSYLRTSLYLLLGGIAFLQLQGFDSIKWMGYLSLGLSVLMLIIGIYRFRHLKKRLRKFYGLDEKEISNKSERDA